MIDRLIEKVTNRNAENYEQPEKRDNLLGIDIPDSVTRCHSKVVNAQYIAERIAKKKKHIDRMDKIIFVSIVPDPYPSSVQKLEITDVNRETCYVTIKDLIEGVDESWSGSAFIKVVESEKNLVKRMNEACSILDDMFEGKIFNYINDHPYASYILSDISKISRLYNEDEVASFYGVKIAYYEKYPELCGAK